MHHRSAWRAVVAAVFVFALLLVAIQPSVPVTAQTASEIEFTGPAPVTRSLAANGPTQISIPGYQLRNNSIPVTPTTTLTFTIGIIPDQRTGTEGWVLETVTPRNPIPLSQGQSVPISLRITIPVTATAGTKFLRVSVTRNDGQSSTVETQIELQPPPTPAPTQSPAPTPTPRPDSDFRFTGPSSFDVDLVAGGETEFVIDGYELENLRDEETEFDLSVRDLPEGWSVSFAPDDEISIRETTRDISLRIRVPAGTAAGSRTIRVRAEQTDTDDRAEVFTQINLNADGDNGGGEPGATPTLPPGCPERTPPGKGIGDALLLRVGLEAAFGICTVGEQDWFRFGAVGGKLYTIDITKMDNGLDLVLELYDGAGTLLVSNDDFPLRDPAMPDPNDLKPRIVSWRAPNDGFFFIRVRDTLGIGGNNLGYQIIVIGEGGACSDQYEPDGLAEQAKDIIANETQRGRVLCPTGDADWVKFFALEGRIYYIATDTTAYTSTGDLPSPGTDTLLVLMNRDGVTPIDVNNDKLGGQTLDSEVRFIPDVDGIYYAQVKNVGEIGGPTVRYDLTLTACPGTTDCGSGPPPTGSPTPTPTPDDEEVEDIEPAATRLDSIRAGAVRVRLE